MLAPIFIIGSAAVEDMYTGPPLNFTIVPAFTFPPPVTAFFVFAVLPVLSQSFIHLPSLSSKDMLISSVSSSSLSV